MVEEKKNEANTQKEVEPIFLASYPRSGNTYLRTILNQCFQLKSASVYPYEMEGNKVLQNFVGHIPHTSKGQIPLVPFHNKPLLIKTHEVNCTDSKSIYVLRDARPVALSLYKFYNYKIPLEDVIKGNHRWGIWADHIKSWTHDPSEKKLLLKYENLKDKLDESLIKISDFLNVEIHTTNIESRDKMSDGHIINKETIPWEERMEKRHLELCTSINRIQLEKFGYV
ncbi:sulfotransferase domain-containing protein [Alphaproteobacteria bacterium]|jgi:hypothetical protein|nr:sulfotransferase domain-containing protein [Alphaproteobacteria bacterium]